MLTNISELVKIDFNKYPIPSDSSLNKHIKVIHSLHSLYSMCINSFELYDISDMFKELFKILFDGYDKIIISASKMENETHQLQ